MKECPACRRCFPDHVNHCPDDGDATTLSIAGEPIIDGRYQLERRLGHGGMGVVFQARHIFLKTAHAIKVILPDLVGNDPMLVTRFRQEALAAAAIRHQNIIAVTDFGVARGTMPFLVMEYVKGRSLQELLAMEGALPPGRALEIMGAVGAGVGAAHRQGIVHRDLKPLNIMMQEDQTIAEGLKVLDFGLAKIKSGELLGSFVQAKTSGLMGSPFYMAPEQWGDEEPDARADIYSLGVILFQMLGGDVPFRGTGIPSIMKKHLTAPVPSFDSMGVSVPPQIERVVRHALEKEAEDRPRSVEDFINELREAVTSVTAALKSTSLGPFVMPPSGSGSLRQQGEMTVLRVHTNPPQSRVFVNNVSVGASDQTGELVVADMVTGMHYVRVIHNGYADWEQQIECSGGECRVEARLQSTSQTSLPPLDDPLAGTLGPGAINESAPQKSVSAFQMSASEQEAFENTERDRIAREELAREEEARLQSQAAARRKEAEERQRAEEEARRKAEAEAARVKAEAEARQQAEAEAARQRAEEEARVRAEEQTRQQAALAALEAQRKAEEETARLEQERREREEAAAAERAAREQPVLDAERERAAAKYATRPLSLSDLDATQHQRQGVITGPVGGSTPAVVKQQTEWQQTLVNSQPQLQHSTPSISIAPPKKSALSLMLIVILAALLVGGSIITYLLWPTRPLVRRYVLQLVNDGFAHPTPAVVKSDLVQIPGGTFQMGRSGTALIQEGPAHSVTVAPFAMDRTEVTNAEYEGFVRETKHRAPTHWVDNKPLSGQELWPVSNVSYDDAVAFAAWRSQRDGVTYRLPTEEEWEFAARNGEQANLYPWGNSWGPERAVIDEASAKPVGSLPGGKNRWGVVDLIGNVWEWTASKASLYPGNADAVIPANNRDWMVYRGGSYGTKMSEKPVTSTYRDWQKPSTINPLLGFRLVRSGS